MDKTILLVDDQHTVTALVNAMLQRLGYTVLIAHDGAEALAQLRRAPVDLVLSDIKMEPMGGFALAKAIRADEALKRLPIVLTTGMRDPRYALAAKQAGADAFLTKPFALAALRTRLPPLLP